MLSGGLFVQVTVFTECDMCVETTAVKIIVRNSFLIHVANCWHYTKLKASRTVCESIFYILMKLWFGNWIHSNISLPLTKPLFLCTAQIDNLFSNQKISRSHGSVCGTQSREEAISVHIMRLYPFDSCVILCGFHDNCLDEASNKTNLSCHLFT